jgi:hypothetical protein
MANQVAYVGPVTGQMHPFSTRVLTDGRNPHPFQRQGNVEMTGFPSIGAGSAPGQGSAPPAAHTYLGRPLALNPTASMSHIFAPYRVS